MLLALCHFIIVHRHETNAHEILLIFSSLSNIHHKLITRVSLSSLSLTIVEDRLVPMRGFYHRIRGIEICIAISNPSPHAEYQKRATRKKEERRRS